MVDKSKETPRKNVKPIKSSKIVTCDMSHVITLNITSVILLICRSNGMEVDEMP